MTTLEQIDEIVEALEREYILFQGKKVSVKTKNIIEEIKTKVFKAKLLDYSETEGILVSFR